MAMVKEVKGLIKIITRTMKTITIIMQTNKKKNQEMIIQKSPDNNQTTAIKEITNQVNKKRENNKLSKEADRSDNLVEQKRLN